MIWRFTIGKPLAKESSVSLQRAVSRLTLSRACATLLLLGSCAAQAESWVTTYATVRSKSQQVCGSPRELEACQEALLELERLVDGRPDIEYRLARVDAQLGLVDSALRRLNLYARSGLELGNPADEPAFAALQRRGLLRHVVDLYRTGLVARTAHAFVTSLEDPDLVAEDITCGRERGSFLVSSVRKRKILRVSTAEGVQDFITAVQIPLWGVFALSLDRPRNVLWATTSALKISPPLASGEMGHSAVLALDAASGLLKARYELPQDAPHGFGDMTVSPDGVVYVSDGEGGGIYKVALERGSGLTSVIEPGQIASPQTPTLTPDGSRLLVPDYVRGIASVDLQRRSVTWIRHPPELSLAGIDGLYLQGRTLIAIQNGTAPERLLLLQLIVDLTQVAHWRVLLAGAPGLGDPTHGCLQGRDFYFIANSGWDAFDENGTRRPDRRPSPPEIWKIEVP